MKISQTILCVTNHINPDLFIIIRTSGVGAISRNGRRQKISNLLLKFRTNLFPFKFRQNSQKKNGAYVKV
jgi:hypothetical protein